MSRLRHFVARNLYAQVFRSPHWKIGWRRLEGADIWDTQSLSGTRWNLIPDPRNRFFADPMAIVHEGRTILFFEDFDHARQKGRIAAVEFDSNGPSGPVTVVLEEPWHLSYPFVFSEDDTVWMIPESAANREVALYRSDPFPWRWRKEAVLLSDVRASDSTMIHVDGVYWLFTNFETAPDAYADLHLFRANSMFGPWLPHRGNPVLQDAATARSAGPIVARGGRLWRPVQDCSRNYGASIGLAEIVQLDPAHYAQVVRNTIAPCAEWPGRRLHTLSQAGNFEFIDGSANVLKWLPAVDV